MSPLPPGAWLPVVVDLAEPVPDLPTRGAAALHVTVLWRGRPLGRAVLPAPVDPYPSTLLAPDLARRFGDQLAAARVDELLTPTRERAGCTGTVVVCTRNRLDSLRGCLEALAAMVPGDPVDVLVVDNGDGDDATRALVEGHGFRWVHEPVAGLDRARNRALLEATGDVVLFTDDDVRVQPTWARTLLRCFEDPLVGAATGMVLPAVLDTAEQRTFEIHFGFGRGVRRRVVDGAYARPLTGGSLGAGASMAFRRDLLLDLGGFPEVLDGGTPTKSGGDTYALYRVLRAGRRGVFEPRALSLHLHREGVDELLRTVAGYSTGTYGFLLYALVHDRDPQALRHLASWTVDWVGRRLARSLARRPGAPPVELAWADVTGGLRAPAALVRAHRQARQREPLLRPGGPARSPAPPETPAALPAGDGPAVSVVVPTRGRRDSVVRLLGALAGQTRRPAEAVVVVDGDVDGTAGAVASLTTPFPVRVVVHERNRGAAAARNAGAQVATGELLLFLDDDVTPVGDGLVEEHVAVHRAHASPVAVVGPCHPGDVPERASALGVRNWWVDHLGRLSAPGPLAFTDLGTGNFSVGRATLEAVGGFRELPRREDWELGHRLSRSGIPVVGAPAAGVRHPVETDLAGLLGDRVDEGAGDLLVAEEHPELAHLLPLWRWLDMGRRERTVLSGVFARPDVALRGLGPARVLLAALDRAGARPRFHRTIARANWTAYWAGVARAAGSEARFLEVLSGAPAWAPDRQPPSAPLELDRATWPPPGPGAVELDLTVAGRPLGTVPANAGGFPWSAEEFGQRVRDLVPHDRLVARLPEEGR